MSLRTRSRHPDGSCGRNRAGCKKGILIKDIQTLEALPDVEVIAFDKTGTLTKGTPAVVTTKSYTGDRETLIRRLVQVSRESTHPLAQAIVRDLNDQSISATDTSNAMTTRGGNFCRYRGPQLQVRAA